MHTNARTAVSSLSAAALAGGLAVGVGLMSPASAMRLDAQESATPSIGAQCQAARAALARNATTASTTTHHWRAPSLVDGRPGLRCGQVFTPKDEESTSTEDTTDESGTVQQTAPLVPATADTEDSPATTGSSSTDDSGHSDDAYEGDQYESEDQDQVGQEASTEDSTDSTHTWGGWSRHHGEHHGD